ncbi:MAG: alpha/beta hydrolase [Bacteroidales bacterium]|nr:alpha/beta hydrolase [Bacteroidales bacterium]
MLLTFALKSQTPSQMYDKPLYEVLEKVQQHYDVKIIYNEKKIDPETVVTYADWKFSFIGIDVTLNNILKPLNLAYKKEGERSYSLISYEYFRKNHSEGKAHLQGLIKLSTNLFDWEKRKSVVRESIMKNIGLSPMPQKTPLNPKVTNKRKYDGYTVENIYLEVLPGVYLSGSLYKPSNINNKGRFVAMLSPHGHFYNKIDKSIPNERGRYRPDQQYRCAMLACMGVVVFSYDMFAWGESTLQVPLKDHRTGLALTMQTLNGMRIIDYLFSLPYIDQTKVGITGASGGGTQAFLLAALDERITLSVPTVMVSSHFYGGCPCESGLPIHDIANSISTNNAEIAALCAPHPQLVISDGNDWTSSLPTLEYPYLKHIYSLYGEKDKVQNAHFEKEGHDYGPSKRFAMYSFVAQYFGLDDSLIKDKKGQYDESKINIEPAENMYAFGKERILPKGAAMGSDAVKRALEEAKKLGE